MKRPDNEARFDSVRNVVGFSISRLEVLESITTIEDICGFYRLTQTELAEKIGIHFVTVSRVKHFKHRAGMVFVSRLCAVAPDEVGYWLPNFIALYCNRLGR